MKQGGGGGETNVKLSCVPGGASFSTYLIVESAGKGHGANASKGTSLKDVERLGLRIKIATEHMRIIHVGASSDTQGTPSPLGHGDSDEDVPRC